MIQALKLESRLLTERELARILGYITAGMSLHRDQQRALASEVIRPRRVIACSSELQKNEAAS